MSEKLLPIQQAPNAAVKLSDADRHALNEALLTAQLRASEAREQELRLALLRRAAKEAADHYALVREYAGGKLGVKLGESHGWDMDSGEVRPLEVRKA